MLDVVLKSAFELFVRLIAVFELKISQSAVVIVQGEQIVSGLLISF